MADTNDNQGRVNGGYIAKTFAKALKNASDGVQRPTVNPYIAKAGRDALAATQPAASQPAPAPASTPASNPEPAPYDYGGAADRLLAAAVKPEDDKAKAKRERLERAHAIIAGIGDMGRAFANLYFTHQYAPNAIAQGETTMSQRVQERIEKAKAARDKVRDNWLAVQSKAADLNAAAATDAYNRWAADEKRKAEAEALRLKRNADEREAALQPYKIAEIDAKINAADTAQEKAKWQAEKAKLEAEGYGRLLESQINRNNAAAAASNRTHPGIKLHYIGRDGKPTYDTYDTKEEYNAAVYSKARSLGLPLGIRDDNNIPDDVKVEMIAGAISNMDPTDLTEFDWYSLFPQERSGYKPYQSK